MTDHRESALSYLYACLYDTHDMTNAEKESFAQVHATLALVEATDAQVAATLAQTAAMERIARDQQKRAVGL